MKMCNAATFYSTRQTETAVNKSPHPYHCDSPKAGNNTGVNDWIIYHRWGRNVGDY